MKKLSVAQVLTILSIVTMAWGAFSVSNVYAASVLYQQGVYSAQQTANDVGISYQSLGTGLTGSLESLTFRYVQGSTTAPITVEIYLQPCPTNSLTTSGVCTADSSTFRYDTDGISIASAGGIITLDLLDAPGGVAQAVSLDPTKYYFILINSHSATPQLHWLGCTGSCYSAGAWVHDGTASVSPLNDIYFALAGTQTVNDLSRVYNLLPASASTTASTFVNFSFDYHAKLNDGIDQYQIGLSDAQTGETFILTGVASSGDHSVATAIALTSGHVYGYTVCLYNSSSTVSFGCANGGNFSVVTSYGSAITQNATSSPFYSVPIDDNTASSSLINLGGGLGIWNYFLQKFPFNWIYGFYNDIHSLSTSDTPYDLQPVTVEISDPHTAQLAYDQGFSATNTPISATITLFSTTTLKQVSDISSIQLMRTFLGWVLWYLFAESTFFSALSIFRKV